MKDDRAKPKHEALVDQALKILGDGARETDAALTIDYAIRVMPRHKNWKRSGDFGIQTKIQKKAVQRLATKLWQAAIALKDPNLPLDVQLLFEHDSEVDAGFRFSVEDLERTHAVIAAKANKPLKPPTRADEAKRYAAEEAAQLLVAHGLPLNVTRKGKFCRLAAVLYGEPDADLFWHCRAVAKGAKGRPVPGRK